MQWRRVVLASCAGLALVLGIVAMEGASAGATPVSARVPTRSPALLHATSTARATAAADPDANTDSDDPDDLTAPVFDADKPDPDVIRVGATYYAHDRLLPPGTSPCSARRTWRPGSGPATPCRPCRRGRPDAHGRRGRLHQRPLRHVLRHRSGRQRRAVPVGSPPRAIPPAPSPTTRRHRSCARRPRRFDRPATLRGRQRPAYLYWKSNERWSPVPATIWVALLAPDGLSLASAPQAAGQDQSWESTGSARHGARVGRLLPCSTRAAREQRRVRVSATPTARPLLVPAPGGGGLRALRSCTPTNTGWGRAGSRWSRTARAIGGWRTTPGTVRRAATPMQPVISAALWMSNT